MAENRLPINISENAVGLPEDDVVRSFVENEIVERDETGLITKQSALTRLSEPSSAYYVLAERGIGKTQVLRYLQITLERRGDIVLWIHLESPIYNRFLKLKEQDLGFDTDDLWKLAIFEQIWIEMSKKYLERELFHWYQTSNKNKFKKSLGVKAAIMRYFQAERPNDYEELQKLWFDQASVIKSIRGFVDYILGNKRKISFTTVDPATKVDIESTIDVPDKDSTPILSKEMASELLETNIWRTLNFLQKQKPHRKYTDHQTILLPSCPVIYTQVRTRVRTFSAKVRLVKIINAI